jgi:hypothetical protein
MSNGSFSRRLLSRFAIASLVFSLVPAVSLLLLIASALLVWDIPFNPMPLIYSLPAFSLVAIVLGHVAGRGLHYSDEDRKARQCAETGKMLGYPFFSIMLFSIFFLPRFDGDRRNLGSEASNVGTIRDILKAEEAYAKAPGSKGFTCSVQELKPFLTDPLYEDSGFFKTGLHAGYRTYLTDCTPTKFRVSGTPRIFDKTGHRIFCADETGLIRQLRKNALASECFVRGELLR